MKPDYRLAAFLVGLYALLLAGLIWSRCIDRCLLGVDSSPVSPSLTRFERTPKPSRPPKVGDQAIYSY
jgi:hypothetical protein